MEEARLGHVMLGTDYWANNGWNGGSAGDPHYLPEFENEFMTQYNLKKSFFGTLKLHGFSWFKFGLEATYTIRAGDALPNISYRCYDIQQRLYPSAQMLPVTENRENEAIEITCTPNPFKTETTVYFKGESEWQNSKIVIANVLGSNCTHLFTFSKGSNEEHYTCKLKNLNAPAGVYFIWYETQDHKNKVYKLIVE